MINASPVTASMAAATDNNRKANTRFPLSFGSQPYQFAILPLRGATMADLNVVNAMVSISQRQSLRHFGGRPLI
jgi:hypothetical protein